MAPTQSLLIAGEQIAVPPQTQIPAPDPADELLVELPTFGAGTPVLLLGVSAAAVAAVARQVGARGVVAADHRVHALAATQAVLALNKLSARTLPTTELATLPDGTFELALLNIAFQPNSARLAELLHELRRLVRLGGRVYVAGARDRGADSAIKRLGQIFGGAQVAAYRKGFRAGVASQRALPEAAPAAEARLEPVVVRARALTLEADAGVFAGGLLDPAARMLAETMEIGAQDEVLDLGCGSGILGMVAATLAPDGHVWLVDTNAEAVALTRRNLQRNTIGNATALLSDGVAAVAERRFDVVVCNPPFHEGRKGASELGQRIVREAAAALRLGGRCYVVASRFLPYEPTLREGLADVREIAGDTRFKVLRGTKNIEQRTKNIENQEPTTKNQEPRTENLEHRT